MANFSKLAAKADTRTKVAQADDADDPSPMATRRREFRQMGTGKELTDKEKEAAKKAEEQFRAQRRKEAGASDKDEDD